MNDLARWLIVGGVLLIVAGLVVALVGRLPGGRLPGDILIDRPGFRFVFPLATCVVISVVLTILLNLFGRR